MARIAETGQRPDDMLEYIIDMFRMKDKQKVQIEDMGDREISADYTKTERNLIQVGFKTVLGPKRVLIRTIEAI